MPQLQERVAAAAVRIGDLDPDRSGFEAGHHAGEISKHLSVLQWINRTFNMFNAIVVIGIQVFVGNTGILSFGHVGFGGIARLVTAAQGHDPADGHEQHDDQGEGAVAPQVAAPGLALRPLPVAAGGACTACGRGSARRFGTTVVGFHGVSSPSGQGWRRRVRASRSCPGRRRRRRDGRGPRRAARR